MTDMEADDTEKTNMSSSNLELEHPWSYLSDIFSFVEKRGDSYVMQCKLCVPKKSNISAYKNSTSNLRKHVELPKTSTASHPAKTVKTPLTQQNISTAFGGDSKYKTNSKEQQMKEEAIARWIGRTGLPLTTVEDEDFVQMMEAADKKLTVPKKTKIGNLINNYYEGEVEKFQKSVAAARKVSIGIDLWSKKGLTASFLAISACYFNLTTNKPQHILLALEQVALPHTAHSIKSYVDACMQDWEIPKEKIMMVITDNGSNMVAAFKPTAGDGTMSEDSEDPTMDSDDIEECDDLRYHHAMEMDRIPCVVHTLQLVVNMMQKEASVQRVLGKARSVVNLFRKSSVATQKILDRCGLVLVNDCPTRWSSTFNMISRLFAVRDAVCQVANEMAWDNLLPSEWQKLNSLHELLLPFAEHTQTLQSDTMSLSLVVPALFDLLNHLSNFEETTDHRDLAGLSHKMGEGLRQRFTWVLDPADEKFAPIVATACFLDPTVSLADVADESIQSLLQSAEVYIMQQKDANAREDGDNEQAPAEEPEPTEPSDPQPQPVFRFLAKYRKKPRENTATSLKQQLTRYKEEQSQAITAGRGMDFWLGKCETVYPHLKPFALDLLAMPASQAFAERVFSVTGDLTRGKRNRARAMLARSAFLKMNRNKS